MILSRLFGGPRRYRLASRFPIFVVGLATLLAISSGCRTSQEARRSAAARRGAVPGAAGYGANNQVDSLLMIQEKLVEVIDSMTSLVSSDHARIQVLENQVRSLEAQTGSGMALPPDQTGDYAPPVTAPPPTFTEPPSTVTEPPPARSQPAPSQYDDALRLFRERNYPGALRAFQSLEVSDPNGALAGNYRYWQGECYFGEGDYARAIRTFESMQNEYPNSPKASAAAFMRGQCYERLGDTRNARAAYERVIADFPNSNYSDRARARLKALE